MRKPTTSLPWILSVIVGACTSEPASQSDAVEDDTQDVGGNVSYPEQGWTKELRSRTYHITEGSQLIPLRWMLALESTEGRGAFADQLGSFGFLKSDASTRDNPYRLPLGFAVDVDDETASLYGENEFVGLTCSACHTAELKVGPRRIRIDGGQNLVDLEGFERGLMAAVSSTLAEPRKLARISAKLGTTVAELKPRLGQWAADFQARLDRGPLTVVNGQPVRSGPGRFDALGTSSNEQICKTAPLGASDLRAQFDNLDNCRGGHPYAAISDIWDVSLDEFTQWGGNVHSVIGRNVAQSSGVYGRTWLDRDADGNPIYRGTADVYNLHEVENAYATLDAPSWRKMAQQGLIPALKEPLVARGAAIYAERCQSCHAIQPEVTPPNALGVSYLKVGIYAPEEVGTDPDLVVMNAQRTAVMPEMVRADFIANFGESFIGPGNVVPAALLRTVVLRRMIADFARLEGITAEGVAVLGDCRDRRSQTKLGYKGATLDGVVWSAPFLHNNSVPTLDDLLKPASQRPTKFFVGCRDYDLEKVGYRCDPRSPNAFEVDTRLPHGSNAGHEYGTDLDAASRKALIEFVKSIEMPARPPIAAGSLCE